MFKELKKEITNQNLDGAINSLTKILHENDQSLKKKIMINGVFKDPLGYSFTSTDLNFINSLLTSTQEIKTNKILKNLNFLISYLYKNKEININLLKQNPLLSNSIDDIIASLFIFLEALDLKNPPINNNYHILSGASESVRSHINNVSLADRYESSVEAIECLLRYLYFTHKDIPKRWISNFNYNFNFNSNSKTIESFIQLGVQFNGYKKVWSKVKYLDWNILHNNDEITIEPNNFIKDKLNKISLLRREHKNLGTIVELLPHYKEFLKHDISYLDLDDHSWYKKINSVILTDYYTYFKGISFSTLIDVEDVILDKEIDGIKVLDILKCHSLLQALAFIKINLIKINVKKASTFNPTNLITVINIDFLENLIVTFFNCSIKEAKKTLGYFIFNCENGDLFSKPLVKISSNEAILSSSLTKRGYYPRILYNLLTKNNIDYTSAGLDFEKTVIGLFSKHPTIKINKNKVQYKAFDKKNIEFDFVGMFDGYVLLMEFKYLLPSNEDKYILNNEKSIEIAVEQLKRREESLIKDYQTINSLIDFNIPYEAIKNKKILKFVVTNIFNFTTIKYDDIIVMDFSSLSKFFGDSEIKLNILDYKNEKYQKHIQKLNNSDISSFKNYLNSPITLYPFTSTTCFSITKNKIFKYPNQNDIAFRENSLIKDPYKFL